MNRSSENTPLNELAESPVGSLLFRYSFPAIVGMVVMSLYNVIDRIIIGQVVGPEAITGLTITFPVMNLTAALGILVGAGASACVSIMLGSGDRRSAGMVLGNALTMTLIFGTIYIAFFGVYLDEILRSFGASDVTLPYAREFMIYLLPGLLMTNLTFSFNNIMRASGYPMRAMVTMLIGAGCNALLAYGNILDNHEITDIQQALLKEMTDNPNITIAGLSTVTGLDRNAVNYQLKKLRKIINIERSGSDKKGSWKISPK